MEERKSGEGKGGEYLENKTIFFWRKKKQGRKRKTMFVEGTAYKISSCSQI